MISLSLLLALTALALDQPGVPHIRAAETAYESGRRAQLEKQWQPAAESFQKAIDIEPTFYEARKSLIAVYLDSSRRLDAAAAITQLLEIEPGAKKYRLLLGQILLEQKQPERALAQFSLVLKRDFYNADGLLGFAAAARQLGMRDRADAAMARGRQHYPGDERFKSYRAGVAQP